MDSMVDHMFKILLIVVTAYVSVLHIKIHSFFTISQSNSQYLIFFL